MREGVVCLLDRLAKTMASAPRRLVWCRADKGGSDPAKVEVSIPVGMMRPARFPAVGRTGR
jgi:hypothetical protein